VNGAQALVEELLGQGVSLVFGHPGGAILPIYDAMHDSPLRHVLCRHEQGASHAADGYARASGRVGVCFATSGPGATNLITGLATAHLDSIPVVAVTGQVPTPLIGTDAFQEADIVGATLPLVKHSYQVRRPEDLRRVVREAFHLAATGRPGPVLVDMPKDIQLAEVPSGDPGPVAIRGYRLPAPPDPGAVAAAAELCRTAERPLLVVGGGAAQSGAADEARMLQELLGCPVASTLMGLGTFPGDHPAFLGMLGMHGAPIANHATAQADLLIAAGIRFDDRVTGDPRRFAPGARIIHIDVDAAEIGKIKRADVGMAADCRAALAALAEALAGSPGRPRPWRPRIPPDQRPHAERDHGYPEQTLGEGRLSGPAAVRALRAACPEPVTLVADVGQHQMWCAQHFTVRAPRRFITSGGLGTMGYALPAAVGVQLARPDERVLCVTGDGGLQMTVQELATVASLRLPVVIAVLDNGYLGMVRQWQELFFRERYAASELWNPDFCRLAEAYGLPAERVDSAAALEAALRRAFAAGGPALIDVVVAPEENTWPIVPSGAAVHEMLMGPGAASPRPAGAPDAH
jgi:acetolactate synthase-1/2/3 large subunit